MCPTSTRAGTWVGVGADQGSQSRREGERGEEEVDHGCGLRDVREKIQLDAVSISGGLKSLFMPHCQTEAVLDMQHSPTPKSKLC